RQVEIQARRRAKRQRALARAQIRSITPERRRGQNTVGLAVSYLSGIGEAVHPRRTGGGLRGLERGARHRRLLPAVAAQLTGRNMRASFTTCPKRPAPSPAADWTSLYHLERS